MSRTHNSLRNIAFGLTGQILNIIMSFAMRTVFIHTLSDIYLGINATCRASFYFYNTEEEVDYFLEKLKGVRKVMGYDD